MKRTTRNAQRAKQEIIEKAAPVFNVHGYSGTSMQMLVDATGYQMGGIYRHYRSKMDLAKEVFRFNYDVLIRPNLDINRNLSPRDALSTILANYRKMVLSPKVRGGCPLLNTATEVDDTDEDFRVTVAELVEETIAHIEGVLKRGKMDGSFRTSLNTEEEAQYLFSSFEGAILLGKVTRNAMAIFNVFNRIEKYIEDNIVVA